MDVYGGLCCKFRICGLTSGGTSCWIGLVTGVLCGVLRLYLLRVVNVCLLRCLVVLCSVLLSGFTYECCFCVGGLWGILYL